MKFRNVLICVLIAISFTSCSSKQQTIETSTRSPAIPDYLLVPFNITPIPESETITVFEGLGVAGRLRVDACGLAFRVVEIVRNATHGKVIIKPPKPNQCPADSPDSVPITQP